MVELKAITQLENVHSEQAKNYLEVYNMEAGLLINFGNISLNLNGCRPKNMSHPGFLKSINPENPGSDNEQANKHSKINGCSNSY
jgi:hypothetical protein